VLQEINDHLKIGQKYMDEGKYPNAIEQFEAMLKLDPANKDGLAWRERAKKAQDLEKKLGAG
jgi:cytochrome c-type biogenesis protein CcmH/NrfG